MIGTLRPSIWLLHALFAAGIPLTCWCQDVARPPSVAKPAELKPGDRGLLECENGMKYFLQVPASYDRDQGARLIVFLHGSNMNGWSYMQGINQKRWMQNDILLCPNGERGDDPFGANNFTFASARFVAAVTRDVADAFKVTRTYIGGHSQGGFVTYSVIMHHPELYQGAFPMAGDCWMQNEPNLWQAYPEKMRQQKEIAIAVIHGKSDPVVSFQQGEHAFQCYRQMGYPQLRLFAPENLGHQFIFSPVQEALNWLDIMHGVDPENGVGLAQSWFDEGDFHSAFQAAQQAWKSQQCSPESKAKAQQILDRIETLAQAESRNIKQAMQGEPRSWLTDWHQYRHQFGATDAAADLVDAFESLREQQWEPGRKLFFEARQLFQTGKKETDYEAKRNEAYGKLERLINEYPASYYTMYASDWLDARSKETDETQGKKK